MPTAETAAEARAKKRFLAISAARLAGVALILGGILVANDALPISLDPFLAYALVGLGVVGTFAVPVLLARKWSTRTDT